MLQQEQKALNKLDYDYQALLYEVLNYGDKRNTRSGAVRSLFGRQITVDISNSFPLLTTKKVFTRGVLVELLWFLKHPSDSKNGMNIKYLVDNNVNIWNDDAYRWFTSTVVDAINGDTVFGLHDENGNFVHDDETRYELSMIGKDELKVIPKEEFISFVKSSVAVKFGDKQYNFGDLGPVYGKQWRKWENENGETVDQVSELIDKLKTNPTDRRLILNAYNVGDLKSMALPPCHVMAQFYARTLTPYERWGIYEKKFNGDEDKMSIHSSALNPWVSPKIREQYLSTLDKEDIPKYALSCMWTQRSVDLPLGWAFNVSSYAFLTYMLCKIVNMVPDKLISSMGDVHIYENQIDGVKEQLSRQGSYELPTLTIGGKQTRIEDFEVSDFKINNYVNDGVIKYPLSVG